MNDEIRLLLKMILAEEEEKQAAQQSAQEPAEAEEKPAREPVTEEAPAETKKRMSTAEKQRRKDMNTARRELYDSHAENVTKTEGIPVWQKYALSVKEAAEYFHLGETKLRKLIRRDRYAPYLIWNGGRVYFKRKMFEEYLDKENEV